MPAMNSRRFIRSSSQLEDDGTHISRLDGRHPHCRPMASVTYGARRLWVNWASSTCGPLLPAPVNGRCETRRVSPFANTRPPQSITSSARLSSVGGMITPSALAVLRLIARTNSVGCSSGMSATLEPNSNFTT